MPLAEACWPNWAAWTGPHRRAAPDTPGPSAGVLVHGAGLFLLPLSLVTAFSFPWTYAFWQTYTVQPARPGEGLRASIGRAWTTACRNPGQNHVLLAVLFLFGLAVLANIVGALALGPVLLKSLLGVETTLVRTWRALFNTTFLVLALAWPGSASTPWSRPCTPCAASGPNRGSPEPTSAWTFIERPGKATKRR